MNHPLDTESLMSLVKLGNDALESGDYRELCAAHTNVAVGVTLTRAAGQFRESALLGQISEALRLMCLLKRP